jgi:starch synthase
LEVWFVDQPGFYQREGLYQRGGVDHPDNAERFIFFAKSVAYLAIESAESFELAHVHDWQAALAPVLMLNRRKLKGVGTHLRTVLTIHNLAFQGVFPAAAYALTNLSPVHLHPEGMEYYGYMNCLKAGIVYSDAITTVSPRYAREITTEAFGCGLDGVLRRRQDVLRGILNGVDYEEWNTTENPNLRHVYSLEDLAGKALQKAELQREFGLPQRADVPVFGTISRLAEQKGVDIQLGALEEMLAADMQFVLLGSGAADYEEAYRDLARRHPGKVGIRIGYDQGMSHRIEAGCDFFLMPSRFEPCGLNQMYSLRYGTIPIVRRTGGLDDSVVDLTGSAERANGIKFDEYSVRALARAIRKGLVLFQTPALLDHMRGNAMLADFSWEATSAEYLAVYRDALSRPPVERL